MVFQTLYRTNEHLVRAALADTEKLSALTGDVFRRAPLAWGVLRYFCAPPVSEEDLWTLVGRKFKAVPDSVADATAKAILDVLDHIRFPWIPEARAPTTVEFESAVMATSALFTQELLRTQRRGQSSKRQELAVAAALRALEYEQAPEKQQDITLLDDLARGWFSRERKIRGAKCDVPVRLLDGRLLGIECKVSNGPKNGWKRLNREIVGKADKWRPAFGDQLITGAVLAGVFDLSCLVAGQAAGVAIFWEHDLGALTDFVQSCKPEA